MARRRGFGEVERRVSAKGEVTYRARYAMPDGTRYSRTLGTKMDAEAWLADRAVADRPRRVVTRRPHARRPRSDGVRRRRTTRCGTFAERYLAERGLRPTTVHNYRTLLATRINPYFGEMPLKNVTLSEIKAWRASLDPEDRVDQRRRVPAAALPAPGGRGGGADRPRAAEDPRGGTAPRASTSPCRPRSTRSRSSPTRCPSACGCSSCSPRSSGCARASCSSCAAPTSTASPAGSTSAARSTRTSIPGAAGACPNCGRAISAPKTASGIADRARPAAVPADAPEAPARAHRRRAGGTALPGRPHRPHERSLPDGPLSPGRARPRVGRT